MPSLQPKANSGVSPKKVFFPAHSVPEDPISERIEIINALQQSLDISDQLHCFFAWLQPRVGVEHLKYQHPDQQYSLSIGRKQTHTIDYRLTTSADDLGQLVFSRNAPFGEQELALLETYLSALLYPLRNGLQYLAAVQAAMTDPLTHLGNRAALDNALHRELRLAQRHQSQLALLMIDIDHFKKINDTYGHATGDEVLKEVASTIAEVTRDEDMCFRYGGEEFVMVLSNTDKEAAAIVAERIRCAVEKAPAQINDATIPATVSVGVSSLLATDKLTALFDRADKALYQAKTEGRNRIVVAATKN